MSPSLISIRTVNKKYLVFAALVKGETRSCTWRLASVELPPEEGEEASWSMERAGGAGGGLGTGVRGWGNS